MSQKTKQSSIDWRYVTDAIIDVIEISDQLFLEFIDREIITPLKTSIIKQKKNPSLAEKYRKNLEKVITQRQNYDFELNVILRIGKDISPTVERVFVILVGEFQSFLIHEYRLKLYDLHKRILKQLVVAIWQNLDRAGNDITFEEFESRFADFRLEGGLIPDEFDLKYIPHMRDEKKYRKAKDKVAGTYSHSFELEHKTFQKKGENLASKFLKEVNAKRKKIFTQS